METYAVERAVDAAAAEAAAAAAAAVTAAAAGAAAVGGSKREESVLEEPSSADSSIADTATAGFALYVVDSAAARERSFAASSASLGRNQVAASERGGLAA